MEKKIKTAEDAAFEVEYRKAQEIWWTKRGESFGAYLRVAAQEGYIVNPSRAPETTAPKSVLDAWAAHVIASKDGDDTFVSQLEAAKAAIKAATKA